MSTRAAPDADAQTLDSPLFTSASRLKIGVFHSNLTRGGTPTLDDGTIFPLDWKQQVRIATAAEDAGIEAIIPIARWKGFGGPSDFNGEQYETLAWAAGLAAATQRLVVYSTVHIPIVHPLYLAKAVATIDHISGGRFCLNVVAGWNDAELRMFGIQLREHGDRYAYAHEWMTILKRLWAEEEPFDFDGTYFQGAEMISRPKPIQRPRPPIMSAGSSPAGRDFAATHADICFANFDDQDDLEGLAGVVVDIKGRAREKGREVSVWIHAGMLIADSEQEAKRAYDRFVHELGDREAMKNQVGIALSGAMQSLAIGYDDAVLERLIAWQHGYHLVGTPEQIVERMSALAEAGIDGLAMVWLDYETSIARFKDEVQPLAVQAGLRTVEGVRFSV